MKPIDHSRDFSMKPILGGSGASEGLLDVLIVGGGPAGTTAAFRAREFGLEAMVIDYDDLMKRIRDYAKDKLILPTFGGGDKMQFPEGGDLISSLQFAPIDKDEMCVKWKSWQVIQRLDASLGLWHS